VIVAGLWPEEGWSLTARGPVFSWEGGGLIAWCEVERGDSGRSESASTGGAGGMRK